MRNYLRSCVKEGLIEEEKLDSFNIPFYDPSVEVLQSIVETEKSFEIESMRLLNGFPLHPLKDILTELQAATSTQIHHASPNTAPAILGRNLCKVANSNSIAIASPSRFNSSSLSKTVKGYGSRLQLRKTSQTRYMTQLLQANSVVYSKLGYGRQEDPVVEEGSNSLGVRTRSRSKC
jgi:hypothetical protein